MQSNRPLSTIVVLILLINVVLLFKIGDLNNRIANFDQNYNNLQSSVHSISANVNQTISQFTREQSWITPVQVNESKTIVENEKILASLNWQIKDYQAGSEVTFHYRTSESGEFKDVQAKSAGAGFFEVDIPFEVKVEPPWHVDMTRSGSSKEMAIQESRISNQGAQAIGYYVSMKTKDIVKSSEVSHLDPAYLAKVKYEPIQGHIEIRDNKYNITIFEHYPSSNNFESVILKIYDANNIVTEKPAEVQKMENNRKNFIILYDADSQNISTLVLQVKYTNGNTFEKDLLR